MTKVAFEKYAFCAQDFTNSTVDMLMFNVSYLVPYNIKFTYIYIILIEN